jgi:serine/threonine protein kinase
MEDSLVGRQLGNFRLERLLGSGRMAQVYHGWDTTLGRPVAVKLIDTRYRGEPVYAARFVREARTVATWRHENIVQVYYADEQDGLYYYVMEYIDGLDLGKLLAEYARADELMPPEDVLWLGRAIADALDYAHTQGMIHRDVKPSNVIVAQDGRVVLTDFGLALDVQKGTMGEVLGSPHYVSPEQARSSANAVPQSDLYSLGIILYEMLAGTVPFDDPSRTAVAVQHIVDAPPPPREINPQLSPETEAVLLKALSKDPAARYQTGRELLDALESALMAVPAPETPAGLPPLPVSADVLGVGSRSSTSVKDRVSSYSQASARPAEVRQLDTGMDDLVGQQLDEYRVVEALGEGGMARVYCGVDSRLNRQVAIKVVDAPFRADSEYLERFEREAQAIARLEHPHIVRLYRYGEAHGLLYMAMQYVDGSDLEEILAEHRAAGTLIAPEKVGQIVREVCAALDYAHNQGVIHRDVKPANIMLDRNGHAVLTDFGLALLTETGTRGTILGSPHYIAPEQAISSAKAVPQSDLYALGVILYEAFTGQQPFDAPNPLDVAMLHLTATPAQPSALRPEISAELEAVILKAMARQPKERYASGQELAAALDRALVGMAVPAPPSTPTAAPPQPAVSPQPPAPAATAAQEDEASTRPAKPFPESTTLPPPPEVAARVAAARAHRGRIETGTPTLTRRPGASRPAEPLFRRLWRKPLLRYGLPILVLCAVLATVLIVLAGGGGLAPRVVPTSTPTGPATPTQQVPVVPTLRPNDTTLPVATTAALPPTEEPPSTATPQPTSPPAPPLPTSYDLRIYKRDKDSLFLVNEGDEGFPLALLRLANDKGSVDGADWGIAVLGSEQCVAVWVDKKDPKPPGGTDCEPSGARLVVPKSFWRSNFAVYYGDQEIASCGGKECAIQSPEND